MPGSVFHHCDVAPFAEKVRLVLGRTGLARRSVVQPNGMPRPHPLPLTGGDRKIPVLQIGADVYCGSQAIVRVFERPHPSPTISRRTEGHRRRNGVLGRTAALPGRRARPLREDRAGRVHAIGHGRRSEVTPAVGAVVVHSLRAGFGVQPV